jgi:O-6-methylguanine DNA methyltransferase
MRGAAYCVFETAIGPCGIAWRDEAPHAVTHFQLPEATPAATEERIARRAGGRNSAVPAVVAAVIEKVTKHLRGELQDFSDAPVDLSETGEFDRMVLEAALRIPAGETRTYGDLAKAVGRPTEARAVGQVMARNPIPLIIPCHRVLAAGGGLGGFSAPGARQTKARLLAIEGAKFPAVFDFPA